MKIRDYFIMLCLWAMTLLIVAAAHSAHRHATNERLSDLEAKGGGPLQAQVNGLEQRVRETEDSLYSEQSRAYHNSIDLSITELRDGLKKFNELSLLRDSSHSKILDDLRDRLNDVEAATADPAYVHSSKLPDGFNSREDGPKFPRIIIEGEKLTWDETDKHYVYAEKHPFGISNRAMWMQLGKTFLIATPDYTDPATGKVWVRHRSGKWYEDPALTEQYSKQKAEIEKVRSKEQK